MAKNVKAKGGRGKGGRKIDPEVQKTQFDEWKLTEECLKWHKVCEIKEILKKEYVHDITETTEDLTGTWQDFEDKLFELCKVFKVKTKLKELKHEFIRSFFFAKEDKKEDRESFTFDGISAGVTKEHSDRSWHLRRKFIEIWKGLDEIHDFEPSSYLAAKKKMGKDLAELLKMIVPHMKVAHKDIYEEKLGAVLRPLANILKTNMRFSAFESNYDSPEAREIVGFKHKTLIEEFCKDLQECFRVLHTIEKDPEKKLEAAPDVHRIFNKLAIENWEQSKIEYFYLSKLRTSLFHMRNHMVKLFVKGIDHWKIPLSNNQIFLEDVKRLVECELVSERLLGDELKRDQLEFVYQTLLLVKDTPAGKALLAKENTILRNSIPKLLIFKTMQKMRKILDEKKIDEEKIQKESSQGGNFFKFPNVSSEEEKKMENASPTKMGSGNEKNFASKSPSPSPNKSPKKAEIEEEDRKKKLEEAENKKYGRFWMWGNYLEESTKPIFLEAVENLRHVNVAVQQDIQDLFITEGLNIPKEYLEHREQYKEEVKKAREFLDHLKMEHNKRDEVNNIRPPHLWNHPKVVEDTHQYRSIAAPHECYKDNRIPDFVEKIEILGKQLANFRKDHYEELIKRVIDCFNGQYNTRPNALSLY